MKVNMTPNPLDVVTIHASQGDTEARQWEFELHNNGELIDTSDVKEQLVFKAYKGGTEQILPENGSVPTTAPFLGDIKYPQGILSDQEFLYRESPTEEDGLAKITDIKGNTLVWNQLASVVGEQTVETGLFNADIYIYSGHKYLVSVDGTQLSGNLFFNIFYNDGTNKSYQSVATSSGRHTFIFNCVYTAHGGPANTQGNFWFYAYNVSSWKNLMLFDLTAMGLDISSPSEFTSLFPLSYYAYNQGSLLSFMGNGIKTVGKNLFQNNAVSKTQFGITFTINDDKSITVNGTATGVAYITRAEGLSAPNIKKGESLILSGSLNLPQSRAYFQLVYKGVSTGTTYSFVSTNASSVSINATEDMTLSGIYFNIASGATVNNMTAYPMLRYADTDSTYEPYTSSTLSLPISTYFPTGMKSAGSVYDELTSSKATTMIGVVDLGSLTWTMASNNRFISTGIASTIKAPSSNVVKANILCAVYEIQTYSGIVDSGLLGVAINANSPNTGNICIKDTTYSSASDFKTAMSGVYLYYELATPTETSFTTASLVTENAEIPLSNDDGVLIGKCTEQLSENPGFIDAKIKLSDADGTCYSNKLQLHVERSPQ